MIFDVNYFICLVTTLTSEHIPTFAECEDLLNDQHLLGERPDPILERHLSLTNK